MDVCTSSWSQTPTRRKLIGRSIPPGSLCYRPAVFSLHLCLVSPSAPQGTLRHVSKMLLRISVLYFKMVYFSSDLILLSVFSSPGVHSACNKSVSRDYFGGKGGRCVWLTTLPRSRANCLNILGGSASWNPLGLPRHVQEWLYFFTSKSPWISVTWGVPVLEPWRFEATCWRLLQGTETFLKKGTARYFETSGSLYPLTQRPKTSGTDNDKAAMKLKILNASVLICWTSG